MLVCFCNNDQPDLMVTNSLDQSIRADKPTRDKDITKPTRRLSWFPSPYIAIPENAWNQHRSIHNQHRRLQSIVHPRLETIRCLPEMHDHS